MDDAVGGEAQVERAGLLGGQTRRELLQYGAVTTAAVVLTGWDSGASGAPIHPAAASLHTFSGGERETLEAILERMIPSGESGDGAREAGVLRYIDRALAGDYSDLAGAYRVNLKAVDAYSRQRFEKRFTELGGTDADAVITAIEEGTADGFTPNATTFFAMLRTHALEGMFGDPYYGGNKGFAGWRLINYPGPAFVVPASHQRLDAKVPAKRTSIARYPQFEMLPDVGPVGPPGW